MLLARLTTLDYVRRFTLAAADPRTGRGVAVARYEPLGHGVAEVAVVVDPGWRRAGLATALIEMLAAAAADRGVDAFSSSYLAENRPVAALLARRRGRHADDQGRDRRARRRARPAMRGRREAKAEPDTTSRPAGGRGGRPPVALDRPAG